MTVLGSHVSGQASVESYGRGEGCRFFGKQHFQVKGRATTCCFTYVSFWQSGNKTAKALKLGTVRGLVGSARKGLMKKVHRRP